MTLRLLLFANPKTPASRTILKKQKISPHCLYINFHVFELRLQLNDLFSIIIKWQGEIIRMMKRCLPRHCFISAITSQEPGRSTLVNKYHTFRCSNLWFCWSPSWSWSWSWSWRQHFSSAVSHYNWHHTSSTLFLFFILRTTVLKHNSKAKKRSAELAIAAAAFNAEVCLLFFFIIRLSYVVFNWCWFIYIFIC